MPLECPSSGHLSDDLAFGPFVPRAPMRLLRVLPRGARYVGVSSPHGRCRSVAVGKLDRFPGKIQGVSGAFPQRPVGCGRRATKALSRPAKSFAIFTISSPALVNRALAD